MANPSDKMDAIARIDLIMKLPYALIFRGIIPQEKASPALKAGSYPSS
jgi:hypothetical protein